VFGVIVGTGRAGGIAVDGRVLVGPNAVAGEWGHNPLPWPRKGEWPGPACYCGKTSCIETFLSGPAWRRTMSAPRERESWPGSGRRAAAGDAAAEATWPATKTAWRAPWRA
jgi:fructokinase